MTFITSPAKQSASHTGKIPGTPGIACSLPEDASKARHGCGLFRLFFALKP